VSFTRLLPIGLPPDRCGLGALDQAADGGRQARREATGGQQGDTAYGPAPSGWPAA
jgi:hypothetical protein